MNDFGNVNGERALLARAAREIRCLREQNRDMRIRIETFEDVIACFDKRQKTDDHMNRTITSDVANEIERLLSDVAK